MNEFHPWIQASLYAVMGLSVISAIGVITLRNLFHAALCLVLTLVGIAAVYLGLHADFLAMIQLLIYVGAIMTLVIFAVMLTQQLSGTWIAQHNRMIIPVMITAGLFMGFMIKILSAFPWKIRPETVQSPPDATQLGQTLMGSYVFPFEVISVVLIAALIGAVVMARKDSES